MNKIVVLKDFIINKTIQEVWELFYTLHEDYNIPFYITHSQLKILFDSFYEYYEKQGIPYAFYDQMIHHFEDITIDAEDHKVKIDMDFILTELSLLELIDLPTEIDPRKTKKVIKKIKKRLRRGVRFYERKCN